MEKLNGNFVEMGSNDLHDVNGGFLGTAILAYRLYKIPVVRSTVNKAVKAGAAAAGAYVGWKTG